MPLEKHSTWSYSDGWNMVKGTTNDNLPLKPVFEDIVLRRLSNTRTAMFDEFSNWKHSFQSRLINQIQHVTKQFMNLLLQNKHVPVPKIARRTPWWQNNARAVFTNCLTLVAAVALGNAKPAWYTTCQLAVVICSCVKKGSIWTQRVHLQHGYNCQNRCQQCWTVQPMITTKKKLPSLHFGLKTTWCNTNRLATVACDCVTSVHRWAVNAFPMAIQTARIAWSIEQNIKPDGL